MPEIVGLLIFEDVDVPFALAAAHLGELAPFTGDDFSPSLLELAGYPTTFDGRRELVVSVHLAQGDVDVRIPRPTTLVDVSLDELHPVSPLIVPHLRVVGLSALFRHQGALLPVFDPIVIVGGKGAVGA